jgi:hypothetical protein
MTQTMHLIKKDVRHLRWALLAWAAVVAAHVAVSVVLASVDLQSFAVMIVARQIASLTSLIQLVMLCLIVSWIVHEDPVADREAFWLTRPIDPTRLATAKLTVAAVALVLLPAAGEIVTMAIFRVGVYDMTRAMPVILLNQIAWVLVLAAAATLTPSLTRYLLLVVAAAAAIVILMSTTIAAFLLLADPDSSVSPRPPVMTAVPSLVATGLAIAVALWVIFYQYRRRRVKRAATLGTAGLVMAMAVPFFWPSHLNRSPDPDPGAWSRDEGRVAARLNGSIHVSDAQAFRRRDSERKQVAAAVTLTGMPEDVFVQAVEVNSQFEVAGVTLRSRQTETASSRRAETSPVMHTYMSSVRGALGSARLMESEAADGYESWPVLLNLTEQDFARYAHTPGRLTATLDFYLHRSRIAAAIPLRAGARIQDDTRRIEIVRVDRRADGCTVMLRDISITPIFRAGSFNPEAFVLRNATQAQAIRGDSNQGSFGVGDVSAATFLLSLAMGGNAFGANGSGGGGFAVRTLGYRFPAQASSPSSSRPVIDGTWLDGAELVRVNTEYAGHVTRSLTINNFRIAE